MNSPWNCTQKQHDNKLPETYKEQSEFKDEISAMGNSENYLDAVQWASQCYLEPRIDREVKVFLLQFESE